MPLTNLLQPVMRLIINDRLQLVINGHGTHFSLLQSQIFFIGLRVPKPSVIVLADLQIEINNFVGERAELVAETYFVFAPNFCHGLVGVVVFLFDFVKNSLFWVFYFAVDIIFSAFDYLEFKG